MLQRLLAAGRLLGPRAEVFALPRAWAHAPVTLDTGHTLLRREAGEPVDDVLRRYFAPLAPAQGVDLGACELMVAMNADLERNAHPGQDVVAYHPGAFHFQLATGEDTLPTLLVDGAIAVEEVVLGCPDTYGEALEPTGEE